MKVLSRAPTLVALSRSESAISWTMDALTWPSSRGIYHSWHSICTDCTHWSTGIRFYGRGACDPMTNIQRPQPCSCFDLQSPCTKHAAFPIRASKACRTAKGLRCLTNHGSLSVLLFRKSYWKGGSLFRECRQRAQSSSSNSQMRDTFTDVHPRSFQNGMVQDWTPKKHTSWSAVLAAWGEVSPDGWHLAERETLSSWVGLGRTNLNLKRWWRIWCATGLQSLSSVATFRRITT